MEHRHDLFDLVLGLREDVAELRATVNHVQGDMSELRQDMRRLDDRFFQLLLLQFGTIATVLAMLVVNLVT